jgi:hypothetical protein
MLLVTAMMAAGCGFGGEEGTGVGITGVWDGEYFDDVNSLQRFMNLSIKQVQDKVSGRYGCQGSNQAVCTHPAEAGDVDGLVSGSNFVARIRADGNSASTCDYVGTISDGAIQGTFSCTDSTDTGTWRVFRSS